jgi:hypothetical protein
LLSTNGGDTWTEISPTILQGQSISGVAKRGNVILAASNPFFSTGTSGLFRSVDNGVTFTRISGTGGLPNQGIFDLTADPTNLNSFYASVAGIGIFRSDDAGLTWTNVSNNSLPLAFAIQGGGNTNLEMAIASNGRLYAGVILQNQLQMMAFSPDQGATWTIMDIPLTDEGAFGIIGLNPSQKPGGQGFIHFSITVDPTNPDIVYVGGDRQDGIDIQPGPDGQFLTPDDIRIPNSIGAKDFSGRLFRGDASVPPTGIQGAGQQVPSPQWTPLTHAGTANNSAPHADSRDMTFDADGDLIQVDDGGIFRRTNPRNNTGDWFSMHGTMQVTELHDIAFDTVSNTLVGGAQDVGTPEQFFEGSFTWGSVSTADGGDVLVDDISLRAQNQSIRYSSNQLLGFFRRRTYDENGNFIPGSQVRPALNVVQGTPLFPQFVTPAALNEVQPTRIIIAGGNSLYESFDRAETLTEIGPGVVVNFSGSGIASNPVIYGGRLNGVPNPDVLYVGSLNIVYVRTAGTGPINSSPTAFPGGFVADIALDTDDWRRAFVADGTDVWITPDAGATWTRITGNLNSNSIRSIEFIPNEEQGFIVVGTQQGVFKMDVDDPGNWEFFGTDVPNVLIFDMDYDEEDDVLTLGTMGRGAFIGQISRGEQIRGTKFVDRDADGVRDINEPGFPGVTIFIDTNNNGVLDPGEPSDVTDALGDYSINTDIGVHFVREVLPLGTRVTFPAGGVHRVVVEVENQIRDNIDFGNDAEPGEIRGFKFFDEDGDGVRDAGEPGMAGVTIQLLDAFGTLIEDAETGPDGSYRFVNLDPIGYQVQEVVPTNQTQTFPAGGVHIIDLQPTQIRVDVNFGNTGQRGSVSGRKFEDLDGDGVIDFEELGVENVVIYVDLNQNGSLELEEPSTRTDRFGNYQLRNLVPGEYHIRELETDGTQQTTPGGDGAHRVTVISGLNVPNINFGNRAFFDFGDAPAPYPTTRAQNGASHGVRRGFFLGSRVDGEADGQPNSTASGDDAGGSIFQPPAAPIPVGDRPVGAFVADLDRTRGLDLVVVNQGDNTISVLLNNSDGTFADEVTYGLGTGALLPSRVVVADFDGINGPDLAVANSGSDNVSVLLNRGDGTFLPAVTFPAGIDPSGIAAGDIDDDGSIDLAVGNSDGTISLLLNDGTGDFDSPLSVDVNEGVVSDVAVGDLDRDGLPDLVAANADSDTVSVLLNDGLDPNGEPIFRGPFDFVVGDRPLQVVLADFNRDGLPDIATANRQDASVSVLLNRATNPGTFLPTRDFDVGGLPESLSAADIDGDRDVDLVAASQTNGRASLLINNGAGVFTRGSDFVAGRIGVFIVAADFNGDGGADVVTVNELTDDVTFFGSSGDDEDGVIFAPGTLVPGRNASVSVTASADGVLSGWVDWNRDGDWADAGEQLLADEQLVDGVNRLFFVVPANAFTGATFARFRFSDQTGLGFGGAARAGEVEDYQVTVGIGGGPAATFTNPQNALDINADGGVTLNDVLVLINDLRINGVRQLSTAEFTPPPFLDPNGDGFITLNDVLQVINQLLIQMAEQAEPEGEAPDAAAPVVLDGSNRRTAETSREDDEPTASVVGRQPGLPADGASGNRPRSRVVRDEPDALVASTEDEEFCEAVDSIAGDVTRAWSEQMGR